MDTIPFNLPQSLGTGDPRVTAPGATPQAGGPGPTAPFQQHLRVSGLLNSLHSATPAGLPYPVVVQALGGEAGDSSEEAPNAPTRVLRAFTPPSQGPGDTPAEDLQTDALALIFAVNLSPGTPSDGTETEVAAPLPHPLLSALAQDAGAVEGSDGQEPVALRQPGGEAVPEQQRPGALALFLEQTTRPLPTETLLRSASVNGSNPSQEQGSSQRIVPAVTLLAAEHEARPAPGANAAQSQGTPVVTSSQQELPPPQVKGPGAHGIQATRGDGAPLHPVAQTGVSQDEPDFLAGQGDRHQKPGLFDAQQNRSLFRELPKLSGETLHAEQPARPGGALLSTSHQAAPAAAGGTGMTGPSFASSVTQVQPVMTTPAPTGPESGTPGTLHALRVEIHPADLGPVQLRVVLANQTVHAQVTTEHADVGHFLMARQGQLETALNASGMDMGQFRVLIDRQGSGQTGHEPSSQPAPDQHKGGRQGSSNDQQAERAPWWAADGRQERGWHFVA